MKWTGLSVAVLTAVVVIGCERNTSTDPEGGTLINRDDPNAAGTSGTTDDDRGVDLGIGPRSSRDFVSDVSLVNHAELQLAQLAAERAQSPDVKQFAQMMIRDHTKAGNELKQAVAGHNVKMPAHLDDQHQSLIDRLKNLRGAEFDREYMKAMVDGHRDAKNLIASRADEKTSATGTTATQGRNGDDALEAAVNQWASKTLPTVEQHLMRAEQIGDKLSGNRAMTGSHHRDTSGAATPKAKY